MVAQATALTNQVNLVAAAVEGLGLGGVLGGFLEIPTLPSALKPFNCP